MTVLEDVWVAWIDMALDVGGKVDEGEMCKEEDRRGGKWTVIPSLTSPEPYYTCPRERVNGLFTASSACARRPKHQDPT